MRADTLVAVAHILRQAEDAAQVDVALDRRFHLVQRDAAGGRDVGDAGHEACCERTEEILHRRRPLVGPAQHGRMVTVRLIAGDVGLLATGAEKLLHCRDAVRAGNPAAAGTEAELRQLGLPGHGVDRGEQRRRVDAIAR